MQFITILRILVLPLMLLAWTSEANAQTSDWSGSYVGAGFGRGFAHAGVDYAHNTPGCSNNNYGSDGGGGCGGTQNYATTFSNNTSNLEGSLHVEQDWAANSLLFGVEPEIYFGNDLNNTHREIISSAFGDSLSVKNRQNYMATLRANGGVPVNDVLLYLTAGMSLSGVRTVIYQQASGGVYNPKVFHQDDTLVGYVVGGGARYKLTNNWVLGGEFLFVDLGNSDATSNLATISGIAYPNTKASTHNTAQIAQFTIAYKF